MFVFKIKSFSKNLTLILSWLLFSPLFLFLSIQWGKPKLVPRIILTVIAPLTLIALFFISWGSYDYYYYQIKRGSRSEIEAKTGMDFPKFKTIEKRHDKYGPSFTRDFSMEYKVQLDTFYIDGFYNKIRTEIESNHLKSNDNTYVSWDKYDNGIYTFSHIELEENLYLRIDSQTGEMIITYGSL